jgi:ABC-2 type transport system permease protein
MSNPIADLSYRNYDGPLERPINRWWAIAKASIILSIRKKFFWVLAALSGAWYAMLLIIFFFMDVASPVALGQKNPFFQRIIWKDQFLTAFSVSQMALFIIALLIGVGAIANDNRANALLVYLSKPVSRLDYLIGKWLGIFVPMVLVTAIPTFTFFWYCFLSYGDYGFFTEDPKLIWRLLLLVFVPAFFHSSVALGVSSVFNQGRLAGATYAGLYFMSLFFTKAMQVIYFVTSSEGQQAPKIVETLYYCSIDGIQIALAKIILGSSGSGLLPSFGQGPPGGQGDNPMALSVPTPAAAPFILAFFVISGVSLLVAWSRIKAVEVVG